MTVRLFPATLVPVLLAAFAGAVVAQQPEPVSVTMTGVDGAAMGSVEARPVATGGVLFELDLEGLGPDAVHGFHVHENGVCDAADGFNSAGGHFAPDGHDHGYFAENGFHAGDMPNIRASESVAIRQQVFNGNVSLDEGASNGIADKAIIIHDAADDYVSQPSGDAGDRIACGLIGG